MKGSINMKRLSSEQQLSLLAELFKAEIETLRSLPQNEAKKKARKDLCDIGIVNQNGEYTEPYIALKRYV